MRFSYVGLQAARLHRLRGGFSAHKINATNKPHPLSRGRSTILALFPLPHSVVWWMMMCLGSARLKTHPLFGFPIDQLKCHFVSPTRGWMDSF